MCCNMNAKLVKWFAAWLIGMVILIALTQPDERSEKIDFIGFETTESAELYFKNMRSFYYTKSEEGGGIFEVYRYNAVFEDDMPTVHFAIYNNWRANEAFIRIDTAAFKNREVDALRIDSSQVVKRNLALPGMQNESQYVFARDVFKSLRSKKRVGILYKDGREVWLTESQVKSLKQCLTDYFRLVGKL